MVGAAHSYEFNFLAALISFAFLKLERAEKNPIANPIISVPGDGLDASWAEAAKIPMRPVATMVPKMVINPRDRITLNHCNGVTLGLLLAKR